MSLNLVHQFGKLFPVRKLDILVVEVEFEFEQGGEMQELSLQVFEFLTELAAHLAHCHLVCCLSGGGNEVGHSFCLTEVELAVHEGSHGEFARLGLTCTSPDERLQQVLHDIGAAVTAYLCAVLARVGVGSSKDGNKSLVKFFAVHILDLSEVQGVAFSLLEWFGEDASGNGNGIRTADSNNGNGSTWRGGKGTNGILFHG